MATREEKKAEAVKRMKILKIFKETIRQFEKEDYVSISEPPFGAFFWVNDKQKEWIERFEKENNALVYMGVLSFTDFGRMISWFYVPDNEEEWEYDNFNLLNQEAFVYVQNLDDSDCSEFGYIGFRKTPAASILRTC